MNVKKGEKEKCKTCSHLVKNNCLTCNNGYFLPFDSLSREKCLSCNVIEHCISCFGNMKFILCNSCEVGYNLNNNKCEPENIIINNCIIGSKELCKSCNSNENLKNECENCHDGFFYL